MTSSKCEAGGIHAESAPISALQSCVERALNRPVIAESAPRGRFEFDLRWSPGNDNQLRTGIEQELGVRIEPEQRLIQFMVVSRIPLLGEEK